MTPEAKAKELIDKFSDHSDWNHYDNTGERIRHEKQCAIICVEQIIEVLGGTGVYGFSDPTVNIYYQEVLEHIKTHKNGKNKNISYKM
jgi:hypothetical protein